MSMVDCCSPSAQRIRVSRRRKALRGKYKKLYLPGEIDLFSLRENKIKVSLFAHYNGKCSKTTTHNPFIIWFLFCCHASSFIDESFEYIIILRAN